jgi:uncharacterized protein (TIGR03083 family)
MPLVARARWCGRDRSEIGDRDSADDGVEDGGCDAELMDGPAADAYDGAARRFLEVATRAAGRYDEPGLGEWSVRDLLGHTSRSLSTVEDYLDATSVDSRSVDLPDAVAYYLAITDALADAAAVAERGRAAGAALGADPIAALSALVTRVPELVRAAPATALVRTPFGTMTLQGYLPTRTLELTVHTCDLAAALGVSADIPRGAAAEVFAVIGGLAAAQGTASAALLALTGRVPLPAGYSVL